MGGGDLFGPAMKHTLQNARSTQTNRICLKHKRPSRKLIMPLQGYNLYQRHMSNTLHTCIRVGRVDETSKRLWCANFATLLKYTCHEDGVRCWMALCDTIVSVFGMTVATDFYWDQNKTGIFWVNAKLVRGLCWDCAIGRILCFFELGRGKEETSDKMEDERMKSLGKYPSNKIVNNKSWRHRRHLKEVWESYKARINRRILHINMNLYSHAQSHSTNLIQFSQNTHLYNEYLNGKLSTEMHAMQRHAALEPHRTKWDCVHCGLCPGCFKHDRRKFSDWDFSEIAL